MPTTPNGTAYSTHAFKTPSGDQALWGVADHRLRASGVPTVVYTHGNSGAYNQFAATAAFAGTRNWMIDNGWAWVESAGGGLSSWGNAAARRSYAEAFAHVNSILNVGKVVVLGRSMGGLVAYWLFLYEPTISAKAVGLIVNSGTTDLMRRIGAPPGDGSIRSAFGLAADGSDWDSKLPGFDPMQYPVEAWSGKKVLQLYGTADTTVPPDIHGQAWIKKYAAACAFADVDVRIGGDHSTENGSYLQTSAMTGFLSRLTDAPADPFPAPSAVFKLERAYFIGENNILYLMDPVPNA